MMTNQMKKGPVTFSGYGVNATPITIVCSRILCWRLINYNGNCGTVIDMDTGKSVSVGVSPHVFEKMVTEEISNDE